MSITIIRAGLFDSMQDQGRWGYGIWGINPGGVMDLCAAAAANMLVGNDRAQPVLEIHFPGPQILFNHPAIISITGADFSPTINEQPVPLWKPLLVQKNTLLQFPKLVSGAIAYFSVHGGFDIKPWLNSYSTNTRAMAGGLDGRCLRKGDEISFRVQNKFNCHLLQPDQFFKPLPWRTNLGQVYEFPHEMYIIKGNEWDCLTGTSQYDFLQDNFLIHPSSDRMGYMLKGQILQQTHAGEMVSSGVGFGTIQLLPGGQPIVLMADHQTAGGYPRLGHVISAHLPKLSQLRPSECIQFQLTDMDTAESLYAGLERDLHIMESACREQLNPYLSCPL
jgi:antagonist of KipI